MGFLLTGDVILTGRVNLLRGAVRQYNSRFFLQTGQLVEERIPFEVGHDLVPAAVIGL